MNKVDKLHEIISVDYREAIKRPELRRGVQREFEGIRVTLAICNLYPAVVYRLDACIRELARLQS